eukprot:g8275.t1
MEVGAILLVPLLRTIRKFLRSCYSADGSLSAEAITAAAEKLELDLDQFQKRWDAPVHEVNADDLDEKHGGNPNRQRPTVFDIGSGDHEKLSDTETSEILSTIEASSVVDDTEISFPFQPNDVPAGRVGRVWQGIARALHRFADVVRVFFAIKKCEAMAIGGDEEESKQQVEEAARQIAKFASIFGRNIQMKQTMILLGFRLHRFHTGLNHDALFLSDVRSRIHLAEAIRSAALKAAAATAPKFPPHLADFVSFGLGSDDVSERHAILASGFDAIPFSEASWIIQGTQFRWTDQVSGPLSDYDTIIRRSEGSAAAVVRGASTLPSVIKTILPDGDLCPWHVTASTKYHVAAFEAARRARRPEQKTLILGASSAAVDKTPAIRKAAQNLGIVVLTACREVAPGTLHEDEKPRGAELTLSHQVTQPAAWRTEVDDEDDMEAEDGASVEDDNRTDDLLSKWEVVASSTETGISWTHFDNFCVAADNSDQPQTNYNSGDGSREICKDACLSNPACSAIEWNDSGFPGANCKLMLGYTKSTKGREGGSRWKDTECHVKPSTQPFGGISWTHFNNFCVAADDSDQPQTNYNSGDGSREICKDACLSNPACSAIEWNDSGFPGAKCKLMLGYTKSTKGKSGTRWKDTECHVKESTQPVRGSVLLFYFYKAGPGGAWPPWATCGKIPVVGFNRRRCLSFIRIRGR